MSDYTTLIKKHNYYDVSRYSESSVDSSSELDIISNISFSDHELQLKEVVISSDFNEDFNNNYNDSESDSEDYEDYEDYDDDDGHTSIDDSNEQSDLDENHDKPSLKMRSFVCSVKGCSKKYMTKGSLQRHTRTRHHHMEGKERKSFICFDPQCHSMKFSSHDLLKNHQQNVHGNGNQTFYVCKEKGCDRRYDTVDNLRSHQLLKDHEGVIKKYTRENNTQKQHISINRVRGQIYRCSKPGCKMSFYELFSYVNHLRVHPDGETKKIHYCGETGCDRFFTNLYDLWNHIRFGHSKEIIERSHKCEESGCIRSFDTLYGLWIHRRSHIREKSELEKNLTNNEIKIYARKYSCKVPGCNRVFDSKSAVSAHKRFHRTGKDENEDHDIEIEGSYNCDVRGCDKIFESLLELRDHGSFHLENDGKICDEPEPEYSLTNQQTHTNDKLGEVNCDMRGCSFKTERFETLKQHLEDDHNMKSYHVCDKESCNFCCTDKSNLHLHQQIHIVAKKNFFKCEEPGCDKVYKRLYHLRYHQNRRGHLILTDQQQNHSEISEIDEDYHAKTITLTSQQQNHPKISEIDQGYHTKTITLTSQQQNHPEISEIDEGYHAKKKNYHACDEPGCDKVYKRVCFLRSHQRVHRNRRKHQASMILTNQQQNHSEVDKNYFACDEPGCDKIYKRVCHLRAHQRVHKNRRKHQASMILINQQQNHSEVGENYFACDEPGCDKIYKRICHLRAHQRVHKNRRKHQTSMILINQQQNHSEVNENYFACDEPGCDKIYKRVCQLSAHQRVHKNRRKRQTSMILTNQQQNHSEVDENYFACDEPGCDKIYNRLCHLRAHQRVHKNRRPIILTNQQQNHENYHACDELGCGKVFKRLSHFTKHKNYNHVKLVLPSVYIENVNLDFNKESTYWCDHPGCFFITKQVENLARHKTIHTEEKRFSCDIPGCNYKCGQEIQLIEHQLSCLNKKISKQPKKKKKYVCDQEGCGERFDMLVALKKHKREDHGMGNKIYASGKTIMKGAHNLRNHDQASYEDDEDEEPKYNNFMIRPRLSQHACNYRGCNRRFVTLTWLKKHKVTAHPNNTDQNFTLNPQLENHDNMQISQIPTITMKRSATSDDKLGEDESNNSPYGLRKRQRINSRIQTLIDDDDDCICKFTGCRKIFNSIPSLKAHQRKFHMITKTYSCNRAGCNFRTKFFEKLEKHQTEKHRMLL